MNAIKVMPDQEKYTMVSDFTRSIDKFALPFFRDQAGEAVEEALIKAWQGGTIAIPDSATDQEKYEIAYENFIWKASKVYELLREELGEESIDQYVQIEIDYLIRENDSLAVKMLSMIKKISPRLAFNLVANQLTYQMQWITPYTIAEKSERKLVLDVAHCKVLDYPNSEDICLIGCQRATTGWVAEQFEVNLDFDRQGQRCTCTATALN